MPAKLTEPRLLALRAVADGRIYLSWGIGLTKPRWRQRHQPGQIGWTERPQPFVWLRDQGLIAVAPVERYTSEVTITDAGREVLAGSVGEEP